MNLDIPNISRRELCGTLLGFAATALLLLSSHAQNIYIGPISGDWETTTNWNTGSIPTGANDVVIDNRGQDSTVTLGTSRTGTVGNLTIAEGDSVITSNNSLLNINGTTLTIDGRLEINAGGSSTTLAINAADTSLTGAGSILLPTANARILGSGSLSNAATIEGRGNVGVNQLALANEADGLMDANLEGAVLLLDPAGAGGLTNAGILQASAGGILLLTGNGGGSFTNIGGIIQAVGADSEVQLQAGAAVIGGTLRSEAGGLFRGNVSQNYFFTDVIFDEGTQVIGENNSDFNISGTITNDGTLSIAATSSATDIELQTDTTLTGTGEVILGTAGTNNARIHGSGTLTHTAEHTLRGRGHIGVNLIGVINEGTITAENTGDGSVLLLDPNNALGLTNTGLLEARAGGVLQLTGNGGGIFTNVGGVIQAVGEGSEVQLQAGASVIGGTLRSGAGGLFRGNVSQIYFFTDVIFDDGTQVIGENNSDFNISGTITNDGTLSIAATSSSTDIELQTDTTLTGTGEVILGTVGTNNARIHGSGTLTHTAEHTIRGRGQIGVNLIGVVNEGTITAEDAGAGSVLVLDPNSAVGLTNTGVLEATTGGILLLSGNGGGSFTNIGGIIRAVGADSEVQLHAGASVIGGTLRSEAGGLFRGNVSQNYFFTDVIFAEGTQLIGENNSDFGVSRSITNEGTITIAATSSATDVELQSDTVFQGSGELVLGTTTVNARIHGAGTLTNAEGHTIRGKGNIGVNSISVFNAPGGLIAADAADGPLLLDPANGTNTFVNRGMLEAREGGILQLTGGGGGSFDNAGGTILAGDGSEVQLVGAAAINGGILDSEGSGLFRLGVSQTASIADATLAGSFVVDNNATLSLSGDMELAGDLLIAAGSSGTSVSIDSIADLSGGGALTLSGVNARVSGNGVLINRDQSISGSGNLGVNQAGFTNTPGGIIDANITDQTLTIDPSPFVGFVNDGLTRASNGGTLLLSGNGGGAFTNAENGTLEARSGGTVRVAANAAFTANQGTLRAGAGGTIQMQNDLTLADEGAFAVEIDGRPTDSTSWGRIAVTNQAALNGLLTIAFNVGNVFTPLVGDVWTILTAGTLTGAFNSVAFETGELPADSELAIEVLESSVEVRLLETAGQVAGGTTYETWAQPHFSGDPMGNEAAWDADPDIDGIINQMEYALGGDPWQAEPAVQPTVHLERSEGGPFLVLRYTRPMGDHARTDLAYRVEGSDDGMRWLEQAVHTEIQSDEEGFQETLWCRVAADSRCRLLRLTVAFE